MTTPARTRPTPPIEYRLDDSFGWDILNHLEYFPDLAPLDFHLFTFLKTYMGGTKFQTYVEVKQEVLKWTKEMAGELYEEGIKKLVPRLTKCIEWEGDYVEK